MNECLHSEYTTYSSLVICQQTKLPYIVCVALMMSTGFFDQFINSFASQKVNSGSTHNDNMLDGHKIFTAP